jgi:hypothetical protein
MAIREIDSRTAEADRHFAHWTQRGVDPTVVSALLPMLVGPLAVQQKAERWMEQNAVLGHDISDEGQAQQRHVTYAAKQFTQAALERGDFARHGPVFDPEDRYVPTEKALNDAMDDRLPNPGYPSSRENHHRLAKSEAYEAMSNKHPGRVFSIEDDGKVYATDPHTLKRTHIDTVSLPQIGPKPLNAQDFSPVNRYESADLSNEYEGYRADFAWGFPEGVDRPFFLD